jgi:hypothetical protein
MQEIEEKKDANLKFCQEALLKAIQNGEACFDADVKRANDTYSERRKVIRKRIMDHVHGLRNQLLAEYGQFETSIQLPPIPTFEMSAVTLGKRKNLTLDQLSLGPGYTSTLPMPDWIRHVLKLRRRSGLDPVYVPQPCSGLEDQEIEQDLHFLHVMLDPPSSSTVHGSKEGEKKTTPVQDTPKQQGMHPPQQKGPGVSV